MAAGDLNAGFRRFLLVRDDFYPDPERVRRIALGMEFAERQDITGFMTRTVYHERGIRKRFERLLGVRVTDFASDPDSGNGIFYGGFARGRYRETPGIHSDEPADDLTVVVYLTPNIPEGYGTSLWRHRATGLLNAPVARDARRLGTTLTRLRARLEGDTRRRERWVEVDRVGYRYNRMVAYASGMLHSATRHFGSNLGGGRLYQTFRLGVDWRTSQLQA